MPILPFLLMLDDGVMAAHRRRTRADVPCEAPAAEGEVLVCGRRDADRYRVSFVATDIRDSVPTERAALMRNDFPRCGVTGPFFLESCGMVGVTLSTNGRGVQIKTRKLAD